MANKLWNLFKVINKYARFVLYVLCRVLYSPRNEDSFHSNLNGARFRHLHTVPDPLPEDRGSAATTPGCLKDHRAAASRH